MNQHNNGWTIVNWYAQRQGNGAKTKCITRKLKDVAMYLYSNSFFISLYSSFYKGQY